MVWFTSDPHFSSVSTLEREGRPFKSVEEYNAHVLHIWNSQARKKDTIYVIGDFVSCSDNWKEGLSVVKGINAKVILVMGNNEEKVVSTFFYKDFTKFKRYCQRIGFRDVVRSAYVKDGTREYYLTHKPVDHNIKHVNLFGHVHKGVGQYKPYGFNMFLDLNYFRLYSLEDIRDLIDKRNRHWRFSPNILDNEKPNEAVFR